MSPSTMGSYERHIVPRVVNCVCGSPTIEHQRRLVVPRARGRVLEMGFGSGLNPPHDDRSRVEWVWGLEPSTPMRALAAGRIAAAAGLDVRLLDSPGEELPLPEQSIDSIVVTYSLCTIPDATTALRQMRRVLRPGGTMLFSEHGAAPDAGVRRWQDRLDGLWGRVSGGRHLNREVSAMITAAEFRMDWVDSSYFPGTPRFAGFNTWGAASPD